MTPPARFCTRCRVLLDAGQACSCEHGRWIDLGASDAEARIEASILVTPNVDTADLTNRIVVGSVAVLGPIAVVFFVFYGGIRVLSLELAEAWPFFLGLPYALLAVGWAGFMTWSALEERKPYYSAVNHFPPGRDVADGPEGRLDAGRLVVSEIQQRGAKHRVVVRDAWIEEPLVLERAGERITVPAGRVEVYLPGTRFRAARSPLVDTWKAMPEAVFRAGVLQTAELRRGDRVALYDGELVPEGQSETTFREAAATRLRWVPHGERTKLFVRLHG